MKYKRKIAPKLKFIEKPIPKHSPSKAQIKREMLEMLGESIDEQLAQMKEGQAICVYHAFQVYDEIAEETRLIRHSTAYKDWRTKVFERDNFICQMCGERNKRLNAHHKQSFRDHEEERMSLENGITVCVDCHKELHKSDKYSKKEVNYDKN